LEIITILETFYKRRVRTSTMTASA